MQNNDVNYLCSFICGPESSPDDDVLHIGKSSDGCMFHSWLIQCPWKCWFILSLVCIYILQALLLPKRLSYESICLCPHQRLTLHLCITMKRWYSTFGISFMVSAFQKRLFPCSMRTMIAVSQWLLLDSMLIICIHDNMLFEKRLSWELEGLLMGLTLNLAVKYLQKLPLMVQTLRIMTTLFFVACNF